MKKYRNITKDGFRKYKDVSSWDVDNWKKSNPKKFQKFVESGGLQSGLYDISNKKIKKFVNKYKEYIHKDELHKFH